MSSSRRCSPVALQCLAALLLVPAAAPGGGEEPEPETKKVADQDRELARDHFEKGRDRFRAGRYREAIEHFELAYELAPAPEILYNIGRCHEELGEESNAVDNYEMYLRMSPEAEDREEVRARIGGLEKEKESEGEPEKGDTEKGEEPRGMRLGVSIGASWPVLAEWSRPRVPLVVDLSYRLAGWLHLHGGVGFAAFAGEEPVGGTGVPTGEIELRLGLLGLWKLTDRIGLPARVSAVPLFMMREHHQTAIWISFEGAAGIEVLIWKAWSAVLEAVVATGPVVVPGARVSDPWNTPGLALDLGGRAGIIYAF
ncbi:MAG: tetratricopeptide repeat protein [Polyangia bacterium]